MTKRYTDTMFTPYITKLKNHFARLFYIQLVMSIYSMIIVVFWGIPFCPLSFLGNICFGPVLTIFLGLCSLLFFTELCYIPNSYIIYVIEILSSCWIYILQLGSTTAYNITFAKPSYLLVITIAYATFFIIIQPMNYKKKNMYLIFILGISFLLMAKSQTSHFSILEIPCTQGNLSLIKNNNELIIVDTGHLGRYSSAQSYVEYTLLPTIRSHYGTETIDHIILLQPTYNLFQAIHRLLEIATIKHIYIPVWHGQDTQKMSYTFAKMKERSQLKTSTIHRISKSDYPITLCSNAKIKLQQLNKELKSSTFSYTAFALIGTIDNQSFTFYPAKYKKKLKK
jgi:hypothetical protein